LLAGHGFKKMPDPRSSTYGLFGPNTKSALLDFRSKKLGLNDPNDVKADSQTLIKLVQEPATEPVASPAYLTLALGFPKSDLLMILSLVSIVECERSFAGLNLNTDGAGLSFGLIQWAQKPGRLFEIVNAFKTEQPALFEATFGGATAANGMLAHAKKG